MDREAKKEMPGYPTDNPPLTVTIGSLPTVSREPAPNPPFNKSFNRIMVADTGGWWRIVIDQAAKSAEFSAGGGTRGAIPTSASNFDAWASRSCGRKSANCQQNCQQTPN